MEARVVMSAEIQDTNTLAADIANLKTRSSYGAMVPIGSVAVADAAAA